VCGAVATVGDQTAKYSGRNYQSHQIDSAVEKSQIFWAVFHMADSTPQFDSDLTGTIHNRHSRLTIKLVGVKQACEDLC